MMSARVGFSLSAIVPAMVTKRLKAYLSADGVDFSLSWRRSMSAAFLTRFWSRLLPLSMVRVNALSCVMVSSCTTSCISVTAP